MSSGPSWFMCEPGSSRIPSREGPPFFSTAMTMYEPPVDAPEASESEARRVQVVARWNSWVQVYDPSDETLTWVNLSETSYAQA